MAPKKLDPSNEVSQPADSQSVGTSNDSTDARPRTPKRRMTPIYDDYQTAVSMIRSGTPKVPTPPPAADKHASKHMGELFDLPKTPNRRYSYSMTDVHRKLAESQNDLQSIPIAKSHTLKQSLTTLLPPEQERSVSIPIFPLEDRDSDDENERLIAQGQDPAGENEENPAGIKLGDDIPLRDMELSQVRSRTRGDPVSSQEIQASSADFEHADDSNVHVDECQTTRSARASGSDPAETSTIGNIVDQYRTGGAGEMHNRYGSEDAAKSFKNSFAEGGVHKNQVKSIDTSETSARVGADAGPPPSWPLPAPPPALPPRSSKRRNSSGMLSSPGGYGNTSGLLNTKLFNTSINKNPFSEGLDPSKRASYTKPSQSCDDLCLGVEPGVREPGRDEMKQVDVTRLSHVSEESSGRNQDFDDSGWLNAAVYTGKLSRNEECPGLAIRPAEVTAAQNFHEVGPAKELSPNHREAENVFYPSGLSTRRVRRRRGMDLGAGNRFGSLDQILAGQIDSDDETLDIVDTSDWETIHDSRSQDNLQYTDAAKDDLPVFEAEKSHSFGSLSLEKAPVSTWDPLSNKTPGFEQSRKVLETLLKSHKESTLNKQVGENRRAGSNNASVSKVDGKVEGISSLPGSASSENVEPPPSSHETPLTSQVDKPKPASQTRYRHPAPLQPEHRNPFTGKRPVLPALPKPQSTSSSDTMAEQMYTHENRNIDATPSVATDSGVSVSVTSQEEHDRRVRDERNRRLQAEIDLYDPDRVRPRRAFPEARLTIDRRVRQANLDPVFVKTQREIGWWLKWLAVIGYPAGGLFALWGIARGGRFYMNDAMLQISRLCGNRVVAVFHQDDILWAQKAQEVMWRFYLVVLAGCVVFVACALYTGL